MIQHEHFLLEASVTTAISGEYDSLLVVLSYLVAVLAGFCALSVIRFTQSSESIRLPLLLSGGVVLGLGIWCMHFTAMLAFLLPIAVLYDPVITLLSVFPAIFASILFLNNLSRADISLNKTIITGLLLAVGIATMHFVGMSAMSMTAYMSHDLILTSLSVVISWGLAVLTVALSINRFNVQISNNKHVILSAFTFGFSVASMHYLAMWSTYFFLDLSIEPAGIDNKVLINSLVGFTILLMTLLILVLFYKKRISGLLKLASTHHSRVVETIDNMQDGFILSDDHSNILLVNKKFQQDFGEHHAITIAINDNLNSLYQQLANHYFQFDNLTESQKMLAIVNSKRNLNEPFKVMDKEHRWWSLRQNRTSENAIIQTWTNITEQVAQERELVTAKNSAIEILENLLNTQEELLETKKMASLGGLVTGVAHELNTPLGVGITSLSSIMEILEKVQMSLASGQIKKSELESALNMVGQYEQLASKSLDRMAKLIQQFKYISVDQDIEKHKVFSLAAAVNDLKIVWQPTLQEKQLALQIVIKNDIKILSYEGALSQVLGCLISNSIEHAFDKQNAGQITIVASQQQSRILLTYSDNGCGIDQEIAQRIFEPFVTTKRNEGGVGLGLHIAYNLVSQKLRGSIKIASPAIDANTIFTISLPVDCSVA